MPRAWPNWETLNQWVAQFYPAEVVGQEQEQAECGLIFPQLEIGERTALKGQGRREAEIVSEFC